MLNSTHLIDLDVIGFSSDEFVFNETSTLVQVPFYRHGNLAYSTTVHCNNELVTLDSEDVFILASEEVTFAPNITKGGSSYAWIFSMDDIYM